MKLNLSKLGGKKGLLLTLAVVFLVAMVVRFTKRSDDSDSEYEIAEEEKKRFTAANSIDIAMATKMVTHAPPSMLNPPTAPGPLLLHPPSQQELDRLSGSGTELL